MGQSRAICSLLFTYSTTQPFDLLGKGRGVLRKGRVLETRKKLLCKKLSLCNFKVLYETTPVFNFQLGKNALAYLMNSLLSLKNNIALNYGTREAFTSEVE